MSKLYDLLYTMIGKLNSSVKTTPQTLTDAEKTQARTNIGAQVTGDYAKKSEIPTVPTKVSAFTNDVGYLTQHQDLSEYAKKDEIPSKLPNPHALTINGKTYDGSSAVSVTVEGGADWNASEGEPGHVKHRTHWIDVDIVEILPETQAKIQSSQYDEALSFVPLLEVKQGDIITVTINGMEYKCTAQAYQNKLYVFGNGEYFGFGNSGAGEPFCVLYMAGSNSGVYVKQDCTISIYQDKTTIHKLDPKFLPDGVPYAESGMVEVLAECQPTYDEGEGAFLAIAKNLPSVGDTCVVNYNGTEYVCVAQDLSAMMPGAIVFGDCTGFGATGNGEPFAVACAEDSGMNMCMIIPLDGTTELTISIYFNGKIHHKLDKELLPPEALNNVLIVTENRFGETDNYEASHNYTEIMAAFNSGKVVFLNLWGHQYAFAGDDYEARLAYFYTNYYSFGTLASHSCTIDENRIIQVL